VGDALRGRVKLYGASAGGLEKSELELELREDATTQDAINELPVRDRVYLYVVRDGIRLSQEARLRDGDELLVFPPVTGGDR